MAASLAAVATVTPLGDCDLIRAFLHLLSCVVTFFFNFEGRFVIRFVRYTFKRYAVFARRHLQQLQNHDVSVSSS